MKPHGMQFRWWVWLQSGESGQGRPCDYVVWISRQWTKWLEATGRSRPLSRDDHAAIDAWLAEKYATQLDSTGEQD